jgi:hypothetical protein
MNPLVRALLRPSAYDHPVEVVQLIETHISWVFLTGRFAYKVKKPVNLGFVDFSTAELRRRCCHEEVRLNRRLAADLYLGVRDIHGPAEQANLGGDGQVIEAAVQMRQFAQRDLLSEALERGAVTLELIDRLAEDLAHFHAHAAQASRADPWGQPERILEPALANLETLERLGRSPTDGDALAHWARHELDRLRERFEARRVSGRIRECHGDLHLGNMTLAGDRIEVFDCLEFSPPLRWIDPISDLAFLVMDLEERGHELLALRLLDRWLETTGDHDSLHLLPWYLAYRALVRAKVTGLRLDQGGLTPSQQQELEQTLERYLGRARRAMAPPRGSLVITHGISGSGKSHAARTLRELGWIHLRSDVERLRLFNRWGCGGPGPHAAGLDGQDPYSAAVSTLLYGTVLMEAAEAALAAGLAVVVDATFLTRSQRNSFLELAQRLQARFAILACTAPLSVAQERLDNRRLQGGDPSEADASVLLNQCRNLETLDDRELRWVVPVDDPKLRNLGAGLDPL